MAHVEFKPWPFNSQESTLIAECDNELL